MESAICNQCAQDWYLEKIIEAQARVGECSACLSVDNPVITIQELGKILEPIMREHFEPGQDKKQFVDEEDDKGWWVQEGEPMDSVVQQVLGNCSGLENEIVQAVIDAEDVWPPDGDVPHWDTTNFYVETKIQVTHYLEQWGHTLNELKHGRRFFSPAAQALFNELFAGVEQLQVWSKNKSSPVVRKLPTGSLLYRARVCNSRSLLTEIYANPFKHVGPPPKGAARAGRMNAEGVSIFYGALKADTCFAEMRPALMSELAVITVKTTKPLRILDFSRLERSFGGEVLSYLQPDFTKKVEKSHFLRRLHTLISRPIVPGHETDYLITQTMAEYLAYVHVNPFDGILFKSAQMQGGMNIVLFADANTFSDSPAELFRVEYVEDSVKLYSTEAIKYKHTEIPVTICDDGQIYCHANFDDTDDDWD